ncbi:hypothetical protein ACYTTR_13445, partial [Cobetia marina]
MNASPWFDAEWYSAQYPDVALSGLSPEVHYLRVGERLGRRPCPSFDPAWYLAEYPDIAQAGVSPLLHFIAHGEGEGRLPCGLEAQRWDSALWRQTEPVVACLQALEGLLAGASRPEACYAAFALGRWYAWQGEWATAAACLARRPSGRGVLLSHHGPELLTVEAFGRSGQLSRAWQALASLQETAPEWTDTRLAVANLLAWQAEAYPEAGADRRDEWQRQRLAWINGSWRRHGLSCVAAADPSAPLSLDNLADAGHGQHLGAPGGAIRAAELRSHDGPGSSHDGPGGAQGLATPSSRSELRSHHNSPLTSEALTPHQREARSPLVTV